MLKTFHTSYIRKKKSRAVTALSLLFLMLCFTGCSMEGVPFANWDLYHSETYENAESYQTGDFSGNADEVQTLAVYWRSGEIKITESEGDSIEIRESGKNLTEDAKMHYYLKDGQLEVRFCASGATIQVKPKEKHLQIEVPKNMQLSIHRTSADVKAKHLEQEQILVATMSGDIEIGEFVAEEGDLSSGSGDITLDNMQVQEAAITTASGDVELSLPEKGAKIKYTTTGGDLETDLDHKKTGNIYVFGDGKTNLTIQSTNGDLMIR